MKKFYGLTGTKLNIAIAVIAGTDFALFGYGEYQAAMFDKAMWKLIPNRSGCYGRSLDSWVILEILSPDRYCEPSAGKLAQSCGHDPSDYRYVARFGELKDIF
jgi:hypothetical protein